MRQTLYQHKDSNIRKSWFLLVIFLGFVIGIGFLLSQIYDNPGILYIAIAFSLIMNVASYWFSDKIALAASGAQPLKREDALELYRIVENLTITAGLPMPRLYFIPGTQINAFATGRNPEHAAIAVTQGALQRLENEELEGVLAHELMHVGNRDILVSSIAVVLAGTIAIVCDILLRMSLFGGHRSDDNRGNAFAAVLSIAVAILAPIAATMIQLAISRQREYLADSSGALLTRFPDGLANALEKIAHDQQPLDSARTATAHLYLANPFKGKDGIGFIARLFMTHPPIEDRIRILRGLNTSS